MCGAGKPKNRVCAILRQWRKGRRLGYVCGAWATSVMRALGVFMAPVAPWQSVGCVCVDVLCSGLSRLISFLLITINHRRILNCWYGTATWTRRAPPW